MEDTRPLQSIPDDELLRRLADLMGQSRRIEADVVAHIGEVEERRLYAREAFPSMFAYSMSVLHLSEAEAYLRIAVARASREHPILLTMLADGRLHLTAIARLAPHLTRENRDGLLERATHRSKRQVLELIAEIAPKPDAPAVVRKLPERRIPSSGLPGVLNLGEAPTPELCPGGVGAPVVPALAPPVAAAIVQPLSPGRYKVQFTASTELHDKLERLRALMGGRGQDGDLAAVIEQAVTEKLERLEARRFARTDAPRKGLRSRRRRRKRRPEILHPLATSPRPSGGPWSSATEGNAVTQTRKADGARSATTSSSTTGTLSASAATTAVETSA